MVLASQFESLVHPFTVLLAVPLAVTGALFTLMLAGSTINVYSQIGMILLIGLVTKNSILLVEYVNQLKERGLRHDRGRARGGAHPPAADPDDLGGDGHGRRAHRARSRRRLAQPATARLRDRGRHGVLHVAHALPGPVGVRHLRPALARTRGRRGDAPGRRSPRRRRSDRVGRSSRCRLAAGAGTVPAADTVPQSRWRRRSGARPGSTPTTCEALGQIHNAEWGRRAAVVAFIVPAISLGLDETKYSTEFFNPSDPANPTSTLVVGSARARITKCSASEVHRAGRTKAEVESAEAGEPEQRFRAALETESDYYDVLVNQELARVARGAVRGGRSRSERRPGPGGLGRGGPDRLAPAGAGADPRPVDLLVRGNALRTARLDLGRRVGEARAVDAAPLDTMPPPDLPHRAARGHPGGARAGAAVPERARPTSARRIRAQVGAQRLPSDPQHRRAAPALRHRALPQRGNVSVTLSLSSRCGTTGHARSR